MSSRQRRRRRVISTPQPTAPELPPGLFDDVKSVALRLALIEFGDDPLVRAHALRTELLRIYEASPGLLIGLVGYLLANFTTALEAGYGGKAAAIDEVTKVLANGSA